MKMVKIGFTGSREGLSIKQSDQIKELLAFFQPVEVRHGDCIGADSDFHSIVEQLYPLTRIVIHPPHNSKLRAFREGHLTLKEKPYLERNKDIVNATDFLIACPKEEQEELRSGTWSTIRYAVKQGKKVYVIYPSGEVIVKEK